MNAACLVVTSNASVNQSRLSLISFCVIPFPHAGVAPVSNMRLSASTKHCFLSKSPRLQDFASLNNCLAG